MLTTIPTGKYVLTRLPTPLDPSPRGPVFDGGLLVDRGIPDQDKLGDREKQQPASAPRELLTPDDLRNKYLFIDMPAERIALFTLPPLHSPGDALIDAYKIRTAAGQRPPVTQESLIRLLEAPRFTKPVYGPTDVRVCGFVPRTDQLRGEKLRQYLADKKVRLPNIEDLAAACAIYYGVTGKHLIPFGRVVKADHGAIEIGRAGLRIHLEDFEKFDQDPRLVTSGIVSHGQRPSVMPPASGVAERMRQLFKKLVSTGS